MLLDSDDCLRQPRSASQSALIDPLSTVERPQQVASKLSFSACSGTKVMDLIKR